MKIPWKQRFSDRIRSRGFDYFKRKKVKNIQIADNFFEADVEGSDFYHVTIETSHNRIRFMDCTCPYAQDSHFCKHMAALFYQLEDMGVLYEDTAKPEADSFVAAAKRLISQEVNPIYARNSRLAFSNSIRVITYIKNHLYHSKEAQTFEILTYCLQQIMLYEQPHRDSFFLLAVYCIDELEKLFVKDNEFKLDIANWVKTTSEKVDSYVVELLKNGQFLI